MALVFCVQHNERVDQFLILKLPPADNYRVQWSHTRSTGTCSHWELSTVQGKKNQNSVDPCSNLQQGDDFCRNLVLSLLPRPHRCCSSYACQNPCSFSSTFMASPYRHLCLENHTTIIISSHLFKFAHRSIKQ